MTSKDALVGTVIDWYDRTAREFPWREPDCSPWGILVSEVMSQQTQMSRVLPKWLEFMAKWPTPADLAAASDADVIRAWDRLGYPRRAVALRRCAQAIVADHGGKVPRSRDALLALPGIGPYTSAAVASFAYGEVVPVVDTNVRRVLARTLHGQQHAWLPNHRRDDAEMLEVLPSESDAAASWNAGSMELGAVICVARAPACEACPVAELCEWHLAGNPEMPAPGRTQAKFAGSDRELRGRIMRLLRERDEGVAEEALPHELGALDAEFSERIARLADALVRDQLAVREDEFLRLPH
jgi:A/G-specific adenine glycosylase